MNRTSRESSISRSSAHASYATRLVLVALLLATVVVPISQSAVTAQSAASIRFAFWGDPAEQAAYQAIADAFEAANPAIDVQVDYTPGQSDYYRKIASDFAAGAAPDVFLTNYRQFGQFANAGGLTPVQSSLEASSSLSEGDFYAPALDAFRFGDDSAIYCLPQNISSLVVYYNEDLFEDAGVPLPEDGWSWDAFVSAAQALTRDLDGDGTIDQYGVVVEPSMYRMVSFIWSAGGEIVDDLEAPTRLTIDTPEALEGLQRFVDLGASNYGVVPPEAEVAAEGDQDRFMRGGAAMYVQSRRPVPTLREIDGFSWNVASLPVISEPATVLHSDAFCMSSSADTDAAWSFIEFAGGEQGQLLLADTGRTVPSMISVSQSPVFLEGRPLDGSVPLDGSTSEVGGRPPANARVYLDNIQYMHRLPTISTWIEIEDAFDAEFDRAFYDPNFDVAAAAAAAIASTRDAFARSEG